MLASHCNERYACEAFDYDEGRCNKAFFDTVCKTSASVGEEPSYPRRFSDMPGFEWFRDWPHSLNESCGLSANLTLLKSANGQVIGTEEQHRLRALCHLHTRCVREHPARCDGKAEGDCPETDEARLRRDFASEDVDTLFWSLPIAPLAHLYRNGGAILFPVTVFMLFVVSSEMANVHVSATQYWMCLEVARQESKDDTTRASCCSKAGPVAAWVLLFMVRDCIVLYLLQPTVMSIVSVQTSFDIIFCGSIAVVVLQADQQLFSTIMTDASLSEISQEYSLVLTQRQHKRLQTELTVVFWNAFFWMMFGYIGTVQNSLVQAQSPERPINFWYVMLYGTIGFALTNDLLVEVFCMWQEISGGLKMNKRKICCRFAVALIRKSFASLFFLIAVYPLDILFNARNAPLQAIFGDIKHHIPITELYYTISSIT